MKRAIILITVLSLLSFGCASYLDRLQRRTAMGYLEQLNTVRRLIRDDQLADASALQADLHDRWQRDSHWLNLLLDHHHTRDVRSAMRRLATALETRQQLQALQAMDDLLSAMEEAAQQEIKGIENLM